MNSSDENKAQAFEYVLGTLSGEEREAFAKLLRSDETIAKEVRYWEAAIMPSPESVPPLAPKPGTFKNIQAQIERRSRAPQAQPTEFWQSLLPWKMATAMAFSLLLVVSGLLVNNAVQPPAIGGALNADYVAILMNEANEPVLTAHTANDGSKLWLKWENWQAPEGHSLQLWSQSRRDGEIRPLLVFNNANQLEEIELDQATWRLIKDSSHLIITKEDLGGSPIDEPSEQIIAKGICIRLAKNNSRA